MAGSEDPPEGIAGATGVGEGVEGAATVADDNAEYQTPKEAFEARKALNLEGQVPWHTRKSSSKVGKASLVTLNPDSGKLSPTSHLGKKALLRHPPPHNLPTSRSAKVPVLEPAGR